MSNWFGGIALTVGSPITVNISLADMRAPAGALRSASPQATDRRLTVVRYLLVSEVTEMFMLAQNRGWFDPGGTNEG